MPTSSKKPFFPKRTFYSYFRIFFPIISGTYLFLGLASPVLSHFQLPCNFFYFLFGRTCHQMTSRSYFILGKQMPFCSRCFGIYLAFFVIALFLSIYPSILKKKPRLKLVSISLIIPLILDTLLEPYFPNYGWNVVHTITGFLTGTGVTMLMYFTFQNEK